MNASNDNLASAARRSQVSGWTLHEYDTVDSTNLVASTLSPWTAVRADVQTAGRGRFQRSWVSDIGGLWLSAVVPAGSDQQRWQSLPLVAGLAVIESLKSVEISEARLRWPNDIMVKDRKLAGLLVDNFQPGCVVIGIGVNVANQPDAHDVSLRTTATRLADLLPQSPPLSTLAEAILVSLRAVMEPFARSGLAALLPRINALWGGPRRVRIDLDHSQQIGLFTGVDDAGQLLLQDDAGRITSLASHEVKLLRELP
jgi:BirA family biotin operon repressor/biotin-[acetyl-CoA-carboxylase] ligase